MDIAKILQLLRKLPPSFYAKFPEIIKLAEDVVTNQGKLDTPARNVTIASWLRGFANVLDGIPTQDVQVLFRVAADALSS